MTDRAKLMWRTNIEEALRAEFEHTLDGRVDRYLEIEHQGIIPNHHFAEASSQLLKLYQDGYFLSAVMVSHAVGEGIFRFVLDRNDLTPDGTLPKVAEALVEKGIISRQCADAHVRIWGSFRNDVHHMNPKVAQIPFPSLAKACVRDLATIENEIFAWSLVDGRIIPVHAKYWDPNPDGSVPVFLRLN